MEDFREEVNRDRDQEDEEQQQQAEGGGLEGGTVDDLDSVVTALKVADAAIRAELDILWDQLYRILDSWHRMTKKD